MILNSSSLVSLILAKCYYVLILSIVSVKTCSYFNAPRISVAYQNNSPVGRECEKDESFKEAKRIRIL